MLGCINLQTTDGKISCIHIEWKNFIKSMFLRFAKFKSCQGLTGQRTLHNGSSLKHVCSFKEPWNYKNNSPSTFAGSPKKRKHITKWKLL